MAKKRIDDIEEVQIDDGNVTDTSVADAKAKMDEEEAMKAEIDAEAMNQQADMDQKPDMGTEIPATDPIQELATAYEAGEISTADMINGIIGIIVPVVMQQLGGAQEQDPLVAAMADERVQARRAELEQVNPWYGKMPEDRRAELETNAMTEWAAANPNAEITPENVIAVYEAVFAAGVKMGLDKQEADAVASVGAQQAATPPVIKQPPAPMGRGIQKAAEKNYLRMSPQDLSAVDKNELRRAAGIIT